MLRFVLLFLIFFKNFFYEVLRQFIYIYIFFFEVRLLFIHGTLNVLFVLLRSSSFVFVHLCPLVLHSSSFSQLFFSFGLLRSCQFVFVLLLLVSLVLLSSCLLFFVFLRSSLFFFVILHSFSFFFALSRSSLLLLVFSYFIVWVVLGAAWTSNSSKSPLQIRGEPLVS